MQETRKQDISAHYDVGNDFFTSFLDKKWQQYSCAVFESPQDTLEQAQENKLKVICDLAGIKPGMTVLDIGCGWGGASRYMLDVRGVERVVGLTLSEEQKRYIQDFKRSNLHIELVSWQRFESTQKFDAIISVGAFEHFSQSGVVARNEGQTNKHIEVYSNYFKKCHELLKDDAQMALHTLTYENHPNTLEDIQDVILLSKYYFPGGRTPVIEEIFTAARKYFDIEKLFTRRLHYKKTCELWLQRFLENESELRKKFPKESELHRKAVAAYINLHAKRITSLAQFSMRKYPEFINR